MNKYVMQRLLAMIPVVLAAIFIIYLILYLTPGDVTTIILGNNYTPEAGAQLREQLGLNRPFIVQYLDYVWGLLHGDLGTSYITGAPVIQQIAARFPNTAQLVALSMFFCTALSIPIGIVSATKPNSLFSNLSSAAAMIGIALPTFWLGLLMILLFSVKLGWLPSVGSGGSFTGLLLPAITLAASFMAGTMRTTRSSMLEALHQDYVRTAKAKGLSRREVIHKHALKNAILPVITVVGMGIGGQLGGSVLTETVFSFPGMGRLLVGGINQRDTPTVLSCLVVMVICIAMANLIVDLIFAYVDPRIKSQYYKG